MPRNYITDFRAALDATLPRGDYVRQLVAEKFVAHLEATDPDLLTGWLLQRASTVVADELRRVDHIHRAKARHAAGPTAFQQAAATGSPFDVRYVVDEHATVRRLGDMTAADHLFVAATYERSAQRDLLLAAYHRRLARRVGDRRTEEVIPPEELDPAAEAA